MESTDVGHVDFIGMFIMDCLPRSSSIESDSCIQKVAPCRGLHAHLILGDTWDLDDSGIHTLFWDMWQPLDGNLRSIESMGRQSIEHVYYNQSCTRCDYFSFDPAAVLREVIVWGIMWL